MITERRNPMASRTLFNREIQQEILSDRELFLVFWTQMPTTDSDIDPTHNPDWVKMRVKYEGKMLKLSKELLSHLRDAWHHDYDQQNTT